MKAPAVVPGRFPDDAASAALKAYLIDLTGLAYYEDKAEILFEKINRRMAVLGCDRHGDYLKLIGSARGADELDGLLDEIAIGETYFFRYPEQFDALRNTILPERIAARRDQRSLRIWSAGCASGAEPYSVSILLEHEWPEIAHGWPIAIEGTDICGRRLERARHALFSEWELRGLPKEFRRHCFRRVGRKWQLDYRYVRRVAFERQNLKDLLVEGDPSADQYDIILCRNVLIYFDQDLMRRILHRLHGLLADGGWLLVGHAEPFLEIGHFLTPVSLPGTTAYRRFATGSYPRRSNVPATAVPSGTMPAALPEIPLPPPLVQPPAAVEPAPPPATETRRPPQELLANDRHPLDLARRYANAADWTRACEVCERHLSKRPLDPDAHFILALVHEHRGDPAAAVMEFRQAVYLDRRFALAHFHLGRLHALQGERRQALRAYSNAIDLLDTEPAGTPVRGGDGLASDELRTLARDQMARLVR